MHEPKTSLSIAAYLHDIFWSAFMIVTTSSRFFIITHLGAKGQQSRRCRPERRSCHCALVFLQPLSGPLESKCEPQGAPDIQIWGPEFQAKRGHRLLAPWIDHKGRTNQEFWERLVQRIISIVITTPGLIRTMIFHQKQFDQTHSLLLVQHEQKLTDGKPNRCTHS